MASNRCYMNNSDSSDTKTSTSNSNTLRRLKRNNKHQCVTGIVTQSDTETIDSKCKYFTINKNQLILLYSIVTLYFFLMYFIFLPTGWNSISTDAIRDI